MMDDDIDFDPVENVADEVGEIRHFGNATRGASGYARTNSGTLNERLVPWCVFVNVVLLGIFQF